MPISFERKILDWLILCREDECSENIFDLIKSCFASNTKFNQENWWQLWSYISLAEEEKVENFKTMDAAARQFCDKDKMKQLIDQAMKTIAALLDSSYVLII